MTPKQCDKLIKSGESVVLRDPNWDETFRAVVVSRDRFSLRTADGGLFDRGDLEIVDDLND